MPQKQAQGDKVPMATCLKGVSIWIQVANTEKTFFSLRVTCLEVAAASAAGAAAAFWSGVLGGEKQGALHDPLASNCAPGCPRPVPENLLSTKTENWQGLSISRCKNTAAKQE